MKHGYLASRSVTLCLSWTGS